MNLNLDQFFQACNPVQTIDMKNPGDRQYYTDFSEVRGGQIINLFKRTITRVSPNARTCQLFTGHIGCGKSTELLRLKAELEEAGFHVIYFESSEDLDMVDVDISDILLAITRQVSQNLETMGIKIQLKSFKSLLAEVAELLPTLKEPEISRVPLDEADFSQSIWKITAIAKESPKLRSLLRQYLEPRTNYVLEAMNEELLEPATQKLKQQGKQGLVIIIDNLDRISDRLNSTGRTLPEYIFVDRGEQLKKLKCHLVYSIPLSLVFSNDFGMLTNRFDGIEPSILPMVPVRERDGSVCKTGIVLLQQMVLARAFPDIDPEQRLSSIKEVFDGPETLERLCLISGGHLRNLLGLLYRCIQEEDPPFSRDTLEKAIQQSRDRLLLAVTDDEWKLLFEVVQKQEVRGDVEYSILLRSLFVFQYKDKNGTWFSINPLLAETEKFQSWLKHNN